MEMHENIFIKRFRIIDFIRVSSKRRTFGVSHVFFCDFEGGPQVSLRAANQHFLKFHENFSVYWLCIPLTDNFSVFWL